MRRTWLGLAVTCTIACKGHDAPTPEPGSSGSAPTTPDVVSGTLTVAGTPQTLGACKPGRGAATFVEVTTGARDTLHYESATLSWNGEALVCARLDRSWGGGTRVDGTSYWRGTLGFRCTGKPGEIAGDLTLDCGNITAAERAQLDANRKQMQDEQRAGSAYSP